MNPEDREDLVRFLTRCMLAFGPGFAAGSASAIYTSFRMGYSGGAFESLLAPIESVWSWIFVVAILSVPLGWLDAMLNRSVRRFHGDLNRGEMLESIAWFCVRQVPVAPFAALLAGVLTLIVIQLAL